MTGKQLQQTVPTMTIDRANVIAGHINFIAPVYGMNNADILHEFIANVAHESGGFRIKQENMNYSATRLRQVWPTRFNAKTAPLYAHKPRELANLVYGSRMGNKPGTDDGYNFRGGGFMQLTGRDMYEKYQRHTGFDKLETLADAVRTDDYYAMDSAMWLFAVEKKLIPLAEADQFTRIVKAINGGTIGIHEREYYYERAKRFIV